MTNNPTIDGVSRELIAIIEGYISSQSDAFPLISIPRGLRSEGLDQVSKELRALLDAPVVERQPVASPTHEMNQAGCQAYMAADGMIGIMHHSSMGHAYVAMRELDPEVAALQSTIAQLQARVADLESGRGEPVAWVELD